MTEAAVERQEKLSETERGGGRRLGHFIERYALIGIWGVLAIVWVIAIPDIFPRTETLQTIFGTQSVLLMLALGLTFPLLTNQFDLSIASVLTLSAMLIAILNVDHGWPLLLAIAAGLGAGLVVGLVNALFIVGVKVDSFIVTLGTSTIIIGLVQMFSHGETVTGVSPQLSEFTTTTKFLDISLSFWFLVIVAIVVWIVLERTPVGRRLLVVGRAPEVARLSGMQVTRLRVVSLVLCSLFAAVAGVIMVGNQGGADPVSGSAYLLPAYAAVFLGATTVNPGRFNVWGIFVAVYFLVTGITGLQFLGVENYVQQLFYGSALVIAVVVAKLVQNYRAQ